jgi:hypothetical protein
MLKSLIFSTLIIAVAMLLLLVRVLLKRNGTFQSQHIHDSRAMQQRGIHCVIDQDREDRALAQRREKATRNFMVNR